MALYLNFNFLKYDTYDINVVTIKKKEGCDIILRIMRYLSPFFFLENCCSLLELFKLINLSIKKKWSRAPHKF